MTDPSVYSFSDNFYSILSQAMERPPEQDNQQDESQPTEDYQSLYEDLSSKYDEQQSLIEDLQSQVSNLGNQPAYMESEYPQDDPNYWTDFVNKNILQANQGDESSLLSQFLYDNSEGDNASGNGEFGTVDYPTKDQSVNTSKIDTRLSTYFDTLPDTLKNDILITSGNDYSGHVPGSKHYQGKALDLRYNPDLYNYISNDSTAKKYGITTLPPDHGNAPHIHLQVK